MTSMRDDLVAGFYSRRNVAALIAVIEDDA